ncbi:hypothetical protein [Halococcus sediminicola]|uniref:hypothetical protein n=1 Tax=Halococcus sediminicola TaxID=1264579 RepID=UPI0012AC1E0E|nr:hypothetical protein [Halococcus sediminicola]
MIPEICLFLSVGQYLTALGLVFNLLGVSLITFSGIIGQKPIRRLVRLYRVDQTELEEGGPVSDIDLERVIDKSSHNMPTTESGYVELRRKLLRLLLGAISIALGMLLQLFGVVVS